MANGKYQRWLEPDGLLLLEGWARDGLTDEAARARIDAQPNDMFYREKCDFIIENNGDLDMLYRDTDALYSQLIK